MYGGGPSAIIRQEKSISKGDSCNTLQISMSNHTGTHIDLPVHFNILGKTLTDYPPNFWFVEKVGCVFINMHPENRAGRLINPMDFQKSENNDISSDCEAILLKTGCCTERCSEMYWQNPPGIDPELPDYLRKKFPKLRFLGMDLISVSSFAAREAGRLAHKAFLCHPNPILPIEDMDLSCLPKTISNMLIAPLYIKDADGTPCTVFANIGV